MTEEVRDQTIVKLFFTKWQKDRRICYVLLSIADKFHLSTGDIEKIIFDNFIELYRNQNK